MNDCINLLDVVSLTEDVLDIGLSCGAVGTVMNVLRPDVFEVQFDGGDGQTKIMLPLRDVQLSLVRRNLPRHGEEAQSAAQE